MFQQWCVVVGGRWAQWGGSACVADTVEALSLAKLENRTLGQGRTDPSRSRRRRFGGAPAIGLQWDALDRIKCFAVASQNGWPRLFGG